MNCSIRIAGPDDFPKVLNLIRELADYVNQPDAISNSIGQMRKDADLFTCFLATDHRNYEVGMALVFFAYSTWVGKMLYLEDLIVREEYRNQGIGKKLLHEVFSLARRTECQRVRWQTLRWNTPAVEFYKKMGAKIDEEALNCDFNAIQINQIGV